MSFIAASVLGALAVSAVGFGLVHGGLLDRAQGRTVVGAVQYYVVGPVFSFYKLCLK